MSKEPFKELISYDQYTGVFKWLKSTNGRIKVGDIAGCIHREGYRYITISRKMIYAHRLAWLYVYGEWPSNQIDHINGEKDDNRISNLRNVTNSDNSKNRKISSNNKSGYLGVSKERNSSKFRATIGCDGKIEHLGMFETFLDAVAARKSAELLYEYHENHGRLK